MKKYFFLLLSLSFAACSLPTTTITLPVREKERIKLGNYTILVHEYRDSLQKLARFRYYPVFHFMVFDSTSAPVEHYVGAWQEYLARFAGRLREKQKEYLQAYPVTPVKLDSSYQTGQWRFPVYDGEISDLLYVVPVRNSYWSVDSLIDESSSEEIYLNGMESVPQRDSLSPKRKISPEYIQKILGPSEKEYSEMKKFLVNKIAKQFKINANAAPSN